jgi:hypothetical protein
MKRMYLTAVLLLALATACAQAQSAGSKSLSLTRELTGQVTNKSDVPLPQAVVYLKNSKTLAVKTFIADDKGNFRFPGLSPNVDYEVHAEYNDKKSDTKTLSSFDSRSKATINLKIDSGR